MSFLPCKSIIVTKIHLESKKFLKRGFYIDFSKINKDLNDF